MTQKMSFIQVDHIENIIENSIAFAIQSKVNKGRQLVAIVSQHPLESAGTPPISREFSCSELEFTSDIAFVTSYPCTVNSGSVEVTYKIVPSNEISIFKAVDGTFWVAQHELWRNIPRITRN